MINDSKLASCQQLQSHAALYCLPTLIVACGREPLPELPAENGARSSEQRIERSR